MASALGIIIKVPQIEQTSLTLLRGAGKMSHGDMCSLDKVDRLLTLASGSCVTRNVSWCTTQTKVSR